MQFPVSFIPKSSYFIFWAFVTAFGLFSCQSESSSSGKIPASGEYTYEIAFAEFGGKSMGSSCTVILEGDLITVINDGSLSGEKGEVIAKGKLLQHESGAWIIAEKESDIHASEFGGCTDGPLEIDCKNKKLWIC